MRFIGFPTDIIIFQPGTAGGYLEMEVIVRLSLGMDPNEALRCVSGRFDDGKLIARGKVTGMNPQLGLVMEGRDTSVLSGRLVLKS